MIELKLETKNNAEKRVLEYLQENVSETLADKINNGVKIVKDNKTLINRKTLSGFMRYACNRAREQAESGANSACIEDEVVFGWAIHYFEEETIEEQLFNEDGSEYEKPKSKIECKQTETKPQPKKPENKQATLFDLMTDETEKIDDEEIEENEEVEEDKQDTEPEKDELFDDIDIDKTTGEVISKENQTFDKFQLKTISALFDGKVVIK